MARANFGETDREYEKNAEDPSRVVAFDTDLTVGYAGGPVPLDHVQALREADDVAVYATGFNQTLRYRASIPGMPEIKAELGRGDEGWVDRADRMRLLSEVHPDADRYTVVDDVDLRHLEQEGWRYYQPAEYAIEVLNLTPDQWQDETGLRPLDYLSKIGNFPRHFPSEELDIGSQTPYSDRAGGGVRPPVDQRDGDGPDGSTPADRAGLSNGDESWSDFIDRLRHKTTFGGRE